MSGTLPSKDAGRLIGSNPTAPVTRQCADVTSTWSDGSAHLDCVSPEMTLRQTVMARHSGIDSVGRSLELENQPLLDR